MNKRCRPIAIAILLLTTQLSACASTDFLPKSQWARFNGHDVNLIEFQDYTSKYSIITLNGQDLDNRYAARTATKEINCLRLDCRLHPGSHTIEISYRWAETDVYKKWRRKETFKDVGHMTLTFLGVLSGAGVPQPPSRSRNPAFGCFASLTFEVQARHQYILAFIDSDLQIPPEEVRIVDVDSGEVAVTSSPLC